MAFLTTASFCFQFFRRQKMVLGCPDFLAASGFFFLSTLCSRSISTSISSFAMIAFLTFSSTISHVSSTDSAIPETLDYYCSSCSGFQIFHLRTLFIKILLMGANFTLSVFEFSRHCIEIFEILLSKLETFFLIQLPSSIDRQHESSQKKSLNGKVT